MKSSNFRNGYTLIESIMLTGLLAIISFAIAGFILTSVRSWNLVSERDAAVNSARSAMNRMLSDIRRIRTPQNILIFNAAEVQFIDIDVAAIDFRQNGTDLLRNSDILATSLSSPEGLRFTYLDATGEGTAVQNNINSIRVWLSLSRGTQMTTLESAARIRNL